MTLESSVLKMKCVAFSGILQYQAKESRYIIVYGVTLYVILTMLSQIKHCDINVHFRKTHLRQHNYSD